MNDNIVPVRDTLAYAIAQMILVRWQERTAGYENQGFEIIIHVLPGQTQAKMKWPPPFDEVKSIK